MDLVPKLMPPLPLIDGDTLLVDNSRLALFKECNRKGEYAIVRQRVKAEDSSALLFGGAIHLGLRLRYMFGDKAISAANQARQMVLMEKWWEKYPTPLDDYRSCGMAQDTLIKYNETYKEEPFQIFVHKDTGKYFVEEPFAMPLGTVEGIKIIWTGRLDGLVVMHGKAWVIDHKTASREIDFAEHYNSGAFKGYCWAAQKKFGVQIEGTMVNGLIVRAPAKTERGKGTTFSRQNIFYSQDRIEEWQWNTLALCEEFIRNHRQEFFPMRESQCTGKYGRCSYLEVCSMSPETRLAALYSNAFKTDEWSPIHEKDIDLGEVLSLSAEQLAPYINMKRVAHRPSQTPIDLGDLENLV